MHYFYIHVSTFYDSFRLLVFWYKAMQNSSKKSPGFDHVSLALHQFEKKVSM